MIDPEAHPPATQPQVADVPEVAGTPGDVGGAIEALLLMAVEPVTETELAQVIGVPESVVSTSLAALVAFYDETGRGFELRRIGAGWRYYTREEHAELITRQVLEGVQAKLSQAALETLSVVAYSQPISRARVSAVRGVNVDGVIRTLLTRGLITEAGHDRDSGAVVFATTSYFLERLGLRSLDDLPPLAPHLPGVDELEAELESLADQRTQPSTLDADQDDPPDVATSTGGDRIDPDDDRANPDLEQDNPDREEAELRSDHAAQ